MRHPVGAFLAVGWLLMTPPLVKDESAHGGYRADLAAEVEDWHQVSAHDTATDCERARSEQALDATIRARQKKGSGQKDDDDAVVEAATHALCVPSDYIYPPPGEYEPAPESL
jgi:hypothetical protein